MNIATFEVSRLIPARPQAVYQLLADYDDGHPSILPAPYFTDLRVLEGGYGAGTVVEVDMAVLGVTRTMTMDITEPDPGHILVETDTANSIRTEFIFESREGGCLLTFRTSMTFADGLVGFLEKLTTPMLTRHIFRQELAIIATKFETHSETSIQSV